MLGRLILSKKRFKARANTITRFMVTRLKINYNDDDCAVNWCADYTKSYYPGTSRLNRMGDKLGAAINIETGYEDKKLE